MYNALKFFFSDPVFINFIYLLVNLKGIILKGEIERDPEEEEKNN